VIGKSAAAALLKDLWTLETRKNVEFPHGERGQVRAAV
jgi:hypothetical protein